MVIKAIGCTHGHHRHIKPDTVDLLIHTGDESNVISPVYNEHEFNDFWEWFVQYPADYKVFVPGNHSSWIFSPMSKSFRESVQEIEDVHILIDEDVNISGLSVYGSPRTPVFGDWCFMHKRDKLHKFWELMPYNLDILITHGPPKTILDLSTDRNGKLEFCGDNSLLTAVKEKKPTHHFFSHIHSNKKFDNTGSLKRGETTFHNVSCCTDGMMGQLTGQGVIINL